MWELAWHGLICLVLGAAVPSLAWWRYSHLRRNGRAPADPSFSQWLDQHALFKAAGMTFSLTAALFALWTLKDGANERREQNLSRAWEQLAATAQVDGYNGARFHALELLAREGQRLDGIDFGGQGGARADLAGISLPGAQLNRAKMATVVLRKADLRGASLVNAALSGTCLEDANLTAADLTGASLFSADLSRAIGLTCDQVRAAKSSEETRVPDGLWGCRENDGVPVPTPSSGYWTGWNAPRSSCAALQTPSKAGPTPAPDSPTATPTP